MQHLTQQPVTRTCLACNWGCIFRNQKQRARCLKAWSWVPANSETTAQRNNNSMLFISSPLGWMFSHGHCMRRILAHAYAVLPVGLDVHMYLGFALPFGLGFEISYGLFHTPPLWVGDLGIDVDAYVLCRSGRLFHHAPSQSDIFV